MFLYLEPATVTAPATRPRHLGSFQSRHAQFTKRLITDSVTQRLLQHIISTLYPAHLGTYLTACKNNAVELLSFIILTSLTNDTHESNKDLRYANYNSILVDLLTTERNNTSNTTRHSHNKL